MRLRRVSMLAVALLATPGCAARPGGGPDADVDAVARELAALERRWARAEQARDTAAMAALLAADFEAVALDGTRLGRREALLGVLDTALILRSIVQRDLAVRSFGDSAVVAGRATVDATYAGRPVGGDFRYTRVWVRRSGRWLMRRSEAMRLP
jgi:ketosteroid isomerase-like protein